MAKPYVEFEVNGEMKQMRFDYNAVADLEEYFNAGIMEIMNEKRVGFSMLRAFFWAGLRWRDRGLTIQRAGNLVEQMIKDGKTLPDLMKIVTEALDRSGLFKFGEADDEEAADEAEATDRPN